MLTRENGDITDSSFRSPGSGYLWSKVGAHQTAPDHSLGVATIYCHVSTCSNLLPRGMFLHSFTRFGVLFLPVYDSGANLLQFVATWHVFALFYTFLGIVLARV